MLELLVLASVLQFEGGCCLLRNAPRTPGKDKPHGSSTVEHDTFFLGRTRSGLKIEQYSTGMYLNPAKKWVIEDQHHSGAQVPLSIAFWRALHGWYFYNILQTLVVARCFKPLIMYDHVFHWGYVTHSWKSEILRWIKNLVPQWLLNKYVGLRCSCLLGTWHACKVF